MEKKPNIIFISMDALRSKNLGCYGYSRLTSPNIDLLAEQGTVFKNAFSSSNLTDKSHLSILSGRHVLSGSERDFIVTKEEFDSFFASGGVFIQKILKKAGYKTYHLKNLGGWHKTGFDYYFKEEEESKKWNLIRSIKKIPIVSNIINYVFHHFAPDKIANKIRERSESEKVTGEAIRIINEIDKEDNFFLWIDYNDTHMPYNTSGEFVNKFIAEEGGRKFFEEIAKKKYSPAFINWCKASFNSRDTIEDVIARYDSAVAYNDFLIGKIIQVLKEEGIFDKSIIFFFSDHGESLYEHGIYVDHHGLYDVSVHVPLIIAGKNIPRGEKISSLVQLEDLAPTILDLIGINYEPDLFDGMSLVPLINRERKEIQDLIFMEEGYEIKRRGIRTERYKYMESASKEDATCKACGEIHGGIIELYDLEKDPDENINLAKENKNLLIEMKIKLDRTIKELKRLNEKRRIKEILKVKNL